ncbi:hypothetical protein ABPG74_002231 [Tetrahymena malaccensis]
MNNLHNINFNELSSIDQEYFRCINFVEKAQSAENKKKPISMDSFYLLSIIGKGSYAKVSLVRKKDDNQVYALKAIKKSLIEAKNQKEHIITERNILQTVNNQYIVKMKYAFQDKQKLFFVLEYCGGGELYSLLSSKRQLNEQQTKFYAAQLVKALEYLHSHNIIYRDLKPENVLIDKDGYIKLTDFGLSKMDVKHNTEATSLCGTPEYLAPEILEQKGHGKPVDWWTLGNIIWEMMTGLPPFYNENRKEMFHHIKELPIKNHPKIQGDLKNLLSGLLEKDPNKRLGTIDGAKEIIDHPWFKDLRWDQLEQRKINPPFVPNLETDIDLKYIDYEFREMPIYSVDNNNSSVHSGNFNQYDNFTVQSVQSVQSLASKLSPEVNDSQMDVENSYEQIQGMNHN